MFDMFSVLNQYFSLFDINIRQFTLSQLKEIISINIV